MSWHFLQEQVAESWEESSLDGAPSALLKLIPTAEACCLPGSEMECSIHSRSGTTCERSTAHLGAAMSMLSVGDSPAKTSAQPGVAQASTESDQGFGWKWPGSFAKYDHDSRSWRTRQCSLLGGLEPYSETWPRWGSMRGGECLALTTPVCLTGANESGSLLPTPSGVNGGRNHTMGRVDEWGGSSNPLRGTVIGSLCLPEFEELVMAWPVMWTAPMPLGMDKFHAWQQAHGVF